MTPEFIKQINEQQLNSLEEKLEALPLGSAEQRKFAMNIRLLKKLNERELRKKEQMKRKNSRFVAKT